VDSDASAGQESELLFPSEVGTYRSPSSLDAPFRVVSRAIELPYKITPRAMRRTFQDLARAAHVHDVVTRSVSGHATEAMQERYSTVIPDEQRASLGRVVELAGLRAAGAARPATVN
jgi:hypothetical protein